jgi:XFP C-terminal domain/Phosphoglucomutase/phosphomannomutase, alpha/beta/alpha domain I
MKVSPCAGKPAEESMLVNISRLVTAYYTEVPDPSVPEQRVAFGTSGHRGSAFEKAFNEWHILAISQAICLYRKNQKIDGPLFLGMETHALSVPAFATTLEVLAANGVEVKIAEKDEYTPTPVISHAIITYNQGAPPDVVMACCGDVPTLETLAAVSIMREHLPDLKIRVINVVDLMKLQPPTEHPHGLSDMDFDELFTKNQPVIFAYHAYPWLIHRLTYRRTNHDNIHVRGYKEEGTITTPFDMTVLNDLDRFHLVMDAIDRLPQTGPKGIYLKQQLRDKLVEHKQYITRHGQDLPEIRNWKWGNPK